MNHFKLKYNISLDKCTGSCNVLTPKTCVLKETKDINVKAFNMITNKNEAKTMANIFHVIVNVNLIVKLAIRIKNGKAKFVNVNLPLTVLAKEIIVGILAHALVRKASI